MVHVLTPRRPGHGLLVSCASLMLCVAVGAQDPVPLVSDNVQPFDFFGQQVSTADDLVVVSSPFADLGDIYNVGRLHVFEPVNGAWEQTASLLPPEPGLNDLLGQALATDGQRIAAGSRSADGGTIESGAVDIFVRAGGTWVHEQRVRPLEPQPFGRWGLAVDIDGDVLAVGAPQHNVPTENEGEVWMYERGASGWRLTDVLTAPDPDQLAYFGQALDLHGDTLIVGTPSESQGGFAQGGAHVFESRDTGWTHTADLHAPDAGDFDQHGMAVATNGDRVAIGSPFTDVWGNASGEVRVFVKAHGAWRRLDRLFAPNPLPDDHFGRALAMQGDLLAVASMAPPDILEAGIGAVHLYRWNGADYVHLESHPAPISVLESGFADTIALHAERLVSGSPGDSTLQPLGGAAWIFDTP